VTGPAKILAVDDEPDFELLIRQRFRQQIRSDELAFSFARHGEEALAVLADNPDIELLLLDINMPVMDGLTLLSVLRERQSPVRAIIVSAYGDMANLRTAMNRGAFDFVTKPVDLADLEITVKKLDFHEAAESHFQPTCWKCKKPRRTAIFRSPRPFSRQCWPTGQVNIINAPVHQ
jgi:YesN/AraC family two-component response regulator